MKKIQLNRNAAYDIGYLQGFNGLPFNLPKEVFGSVSKSIHDTAERGYQAGKTDLSHESNKNAKVSKEENIEKKKCPSCGSMQMRQSSTDWVCIDCGFTACI